MNAPPKHSNALPGRSPRTAVAFSVAALFGLLASICTLIGCGPGPSETGFRVALITPGPISDDGWNAIAYEGLMRVSSELGAATKHVRVNSPSSFEATFRDFAVGGYDLIIGHGFEFSDTALALGAEFPQTAFLVTAGIVHAANVTSVEFAIEEPAELAGILAGYLTRSGRVGAVGGVEIPPVKKAFVAFEKGVRSVRPDATVSVTYVGSWEDVAAARQQALALMDQGADVLFHDADAAGLGMINAAEERGVLAIGCNKDQSSLKPRTVVSSVTLDVPGAFVRIAKEVRAGTHQGRIERFDLKSRLVGHALNPDLLARVPEEARAAIDAAAARIVRGG